MKASFAAAVAAIDAANAGDPHTIVVRGVTRPKELAHAELATEWVLRLDPDADEAQLLAVRAHHLRRWESPRSEYAEGRAGYLRWRMAAKRRHAEEVAGLLVAAGYGDDVVDRVQRIIRKDGLSSDPAVQTHEDALCLVFLETQLVEVSEALGDDKTVAVLARTAAKMSQRGLSEAMRLPLSEHSRRLLVTALASIDDTPGDTA